MTASLYFDDPELSRALLPGKSVQKEAGQVQEENQANSDVVEEYEGECEECTREVRQKVCPICGD